MATQPVAGAAPAARPATIQRPSAGSGIAVAVIAGTAVAGVTHHDAGTASAAYNMFFQLGGAIGLAALTTVAATSIHSDLASRAHAHLAGAHAQVLSHALTHGWGAAFAAGAGFAALALLVALAVVHVRAGEINPAHLH